MTITLSTDLPAYPTFTEGIRRAPDRGYRLTPAQTETALRNALRYIPVELHEQLAPELMDELLTRGKIYGYRFRPPVRKLRVVSSWAWISPVLSSAGRDWAEPTTT